MTTPASTAVPLYYVLLSGARGEWSNLVQIESDAGFPPTAHPHRRNLLSYAVNVLAHLEVQKRGKRLFYRLTPLGELYLDAAHAAYGPTKRYDFHD